MVKLEPFEIGYTRPANQNGMKINVITGEYYYVPKAEWQKRMRKVIVLELKDWLIIEKMLYGPCIKFKCNLDFDLISNSFEALDLAVGKLPE
jgi:hypothetical protein